MTKLTLVDIFTDNVVKKPKVVSNEIRQLAREDLQIAVLKSNRDLRSKYEMPKTCLKNIDEIRFLVANTEESVFSENGRDFEKYIESVLTYILFLSDKNLSLDSIIFRFLINIDINDMYINPDCAEILFADLIYSTCSYSEKYKCINQVITEIKNRIPFIVNDYSNGKRYSETKCINYSLNPKTRTSMSQYREGQLDSIFQILFNKGEYKPIDWNESIVSLASLFDKEEEEEEQKDEKINEKEEKANENEKSPSIISEIDKILETDKNETDIKLPEIKPAVKEILKDENPEKEESKSIISEIDSLISQGPSKIEENTTLKTENTEKTEKSESTNSTINSKSTDSSVHIQQLFDDESVYSFTTDDSESNSMVPSLVPSVKSQKSNVSVKSQKSTTPKPVIQELETESETELETDIETESNRSAEKTILNHPNKKENYSDSNTDNSSLYSSFSEDEELESEDDHSIKTASTKNQEIVNTIKQFKHSKTPSIGSVGSIKSQKSNKSHISLSCKSCKNPTEKVDYKTIVFKTNPSTAIFCSNECMTNWEP